MQIRPEQAHSINGVAGRLYALNVPPAPWVAGVFANQKWSSVPRAIRGYGPGAEITVEMRFDDNCRNGKMSFAITADVVTPASRRRRDVEACGCLHEDIAKVFPELAEFIEWHLFDTNGPMHYVANAVYLASDRDYNGRAKGEASAWAYGYRFDDVPIVHVVTDKFYKWIEARRVFNKATLRTNPDNGEFRVVPIAYVEKPGGTYKFGPKYTFAGFGETWYDCPFDNEAEAQGFAEALNKCRVHPTEIVTARSDGKTRELDKARRAANWPDATDEQLSVPRDQLEKALLDRLPAMMERFKAAMIGAGFLWSAPTQE